MSNAANGSVLLEVKNLKVYFPVYEGVFQRKVTDVKAVDGVSFTIHRGETMGLVGESGCGKTTAIMEILNLVKPVSGTIAVLGRDTAQLSLADRFAIRRDLQVVFQEAFSEAPMGEQHGNLYIPPIS